MATIKKKAPSVAILALNPSVDVSYEVPRLLANQKAHATSTRYDPGGNGINVARALKKLGLCAHIYGFVAGESGEFLLHLVRKQLGDDHFFRILGETRINSTVLQNEPRRQYEVSAPGPAVPDKSLERVCEDFLSACGDGYGVLTGSVQPDISASIYADMARRIRSQGGYPVVDAHDELLRQAISARPFLIKPNRYELEMLIAKRLTRLTDVAREARHLQGTGIDNVCVSLGAEGALLANHQGCLHAKAPQLPVRSTVGAGDSMLAGLLMAFVKNKGAKEALRLGIACGSATATHPGTELFSTDEVRQWSSQITVRRIKHC